MPVDFNEVTLDKIVVHKVGNITQNESLEVSGEDFEVKDEILNELLLKYYLNPFKSEELHKFHHATDLGLNEIYSYSKSVFDNPDSFIYNSVNMAKHLHEKSIHPNIKGGEFYLVYFSDCKVDGDFVDALGLFKSENKERFLKIYKEGAEFGIDHGEGININKLDKGCLIFNMREEGGYRVSIVDNTNKSSEVAQYWKKEFLGVEPLEDNFYHTNTYLDICKGFCEDVFTPENEVAKTDQMLLMDRSINYFNRNEAFNVKQFQQEVIRDPGVIDAFEEYKGEYTEQNDVETFDEFDIASSAVKSNKKFFKNVVKLDKKFHVYVHGGHDSMERGFDEEKQMSYYKLYFHKEL